MDALRTLEGNDEWQLTAAYYAIYFSLYAVLMKIGIKSEIHTCTVEVMETILKDFFTRDDFKLVEKSFKARKDMQYYTDKEISERERKAILKFTPRFMVRCIEIAAEVDPKDIQDIRDNLSWKIKQKQD